jgi:transketolase
VRLSREKFPIVLDEGYAFELGKWPILAAGTDVSIVACGVMVSAALQARELLGRDGISAEVVNASSVKPLDRETILASAKKTRAVVTAEEHQVAGGLGSAVCELLACERPTRVVRVGMQDEFGQSGSADVLLAHYGLDAHGLVAAAKRVLAR